MDSEGQTNLRHCTTPKVGRMRTVFAVTLNLRPLKEGPASFLLLFKSIALSSSLLYPQHPNQHLTHSRD